MRNFLLLPLAAVLLCACAERNLKVGAYKSGVVVEAEGPTAVEARRQAVSGLLELFVSSRTLADQRSVVSEKILSRASDFIPRERLMSSRQRAGVALLRALVSTDKLGRELEALSLIKPDGVAGRPLLLVRVLESGPGAGEHAASEMMRRALSSQGYAVVDLSSATKDAANIEARKLRTGALVSGSVESSAVEESRLPAFHPAQAKLSLKAVAVPDAEALDEVSAQATGLDSSLGASGVKAISAAGEIGAAKLRRVLSSRFRERTEMAVLFLGLGNVAKAKKLIDDLRADPHVVAASLDSIIGEDVKVRIFVENSSADELASSLMRLPSYAFNIRAVERDYHYVELDASGKFFHAF